MEILQINNKKRTPQGVNPPQGFLVRKYMPTNIIRPTGLHGFFRSILSGKLSAADPLVAVYGYPLWDILNAFCLFLIITPYFLPPLPNLFKNSPESNPILPDNAHLVKQITKPLRS